jgi:diguanylate cyclase (GGDEF)-like protein
VLAAGEAGQGQALTDEVRERAGPYLEGLRKRLAARKHALEASLDLVLWLVLAPALLSLAALFATWRQQHERAQAEAQARTALAASSAELGTLREVGELLQACDTPEEVARVAHRAAERLVPGLGLALFIDEDRGGDALMPIGAWGLGTPERVPRAACWALKRGRANDPSSAVACDACAPGAGCLCVPLLARGEAFGVLWAGGRALTAHETRLVTTLADQLALALGDIRLREELRAQALRDPLTGLNNRRFLDEVGDKLCLQTMRRGGQLAVIMLDLDHFKALNDSLGHAAGDAALRRVGHIIAEGLRRSDICCRYGGEEFALILADCSLENAAIRAEQLRRRMEREPDARAVPPVTASFGVAALPTCGTSMADLLRAADEALYRAKEAGRNRVETASVVPPPAPAPALRLAAGAD